MPVDPRSLPARLRDPSFAAPTVSPGTVAGWQTAASIGNLATNFGVGNIQLNKGPFQCPPGHDLYAGQCIPRTRVLGTPASKTRPYTTYRVRFGNTASDIARQHGISLEALVAANTHKKRMVSDSGRVVFAQLEEDERLNIPASPRNLSGPGALGAGQGQPCDWVNWCDSGYHCTDSNGGVCVPDNLPPLVSGGTAQGGRPPKARPRPKRPAGNYAKQHGNAAGKMVKQAGQIFRSAQRQGLDNRVIESRGIESRTLAGILPRPDRPGDTVVRHQGPIGRTCLTSDNQAGYRMGNGPCQPIMIQSALGAPRRRPVGMHPTVTVGHGESMLDIARRHNVSTANLARANPHKPLMRRADGAIAFARTTPGEKLNVPARRMGAVSGPHQMPGQWDVPPAVADICPDGSHFDQVAFTCVKDTKSPPAGTRPPLGGWPLPPQQFCGVGLHWDGSKCVPTRAPHHTTRRRGKSTEFYLGEEGSSDDGGDQGGGDQGGGDQTGGDTGGDTGDTGGISVCPNGQHFSVADFGCVPDSQPASGGGPPGSYPAPAGGCPPGESAGGDSDGNLYCTPSGGTPTDDSPTVGASCGQNATVGTDLQCACAPGFDPAGPDTNDCVKAKSGPGGGKTTGPPPTSKGGVKTPDGKSALTAPKPAEDDYTWWIVGGVAVAAVAVGAGAFFLAKPKAGGKPGSKPKPASKSKHTSAR